MILLILGFTGYLALVVFLARFMKMSDREANDGRD